MKIINPLSPNKTEEDIKTVLNVLAGQGGCDGEPYDQMVQAAEYIHTLEEKIKRQHDDIKQMGETYDKYYVQTKQLTDKIWSLEKQIERLEAESLQCPACGCVIDYRDFDKGDNIRRGDFTTRFQDMTKKIESLKCCGNCKAFSNCHFMLGGAVDIGIKLPASSICDKWEDRK